MDKENRNRKVAFALAALFVLIVGIIGHIQLLQQQAQTDATARNAANHEAQLDENLARCYTLPFDQQSICIRNSYDAYRTTERAEENLTAQQYIAKTGFWLWSIGAIQALVAVVGIYFIALTLDASKAAVAAANRTADEAKRIGEAQTRAYMSVEEIFVSIQKNDKGIINYGEFAPTFEIKFSNTGNSPALSFSCDVRVFYVHFRHANPEAHGNIGGPQDHNIGLQPLGVNVASSKTHCARIRCLPAYLREDDMKEFDQSGLVVTATVRSFYKDVFGQMIDEQESFTAHVPAKAVGTKFRMTGAWNTADEQAQLIAAGGGIAVIARVDSQTQ